MQKSEIMPHRDGVFGHRSLKMLSEKATETTGLGTAQPQTCPSRSRQDLTSCRAGLGPSVWLLCFGVHSHPIPLPGGHAEGTAPNTGLSSAARDLTGGLGDRGTPSQV